MRLMIRVVLFFVISSISTAKQNPIKSFQCKVVGYDATNAILNCDDKVKMNFKTPKLWLLSERGENLVINQIISFSLDDKQFSEWLKLNSVTIKKSLSKQKGRL
ncbi:MAG: hypothetical protein H6625_12290 [Bdellovibrionaceae bacterium]|nr:hypothetical protein [Pseudobdellovibrionaceae bacterium]